MTHKQLKDIMQRNLIVDCEIFDTIAFVTELLEHQAEELEANEPYATRSIRDIESAANIVYNLQDYVSELEDDE